MTPARRGSPARRREPGVDVHSQRLEDLQAACAKDDVFSLYGLPTESWVIQKELFEMVERVRAAQRGGAELAFPERDEK